MKGKKSKKKIILFLFLIIVLAVGIIFGYSAAYFTSTIINNPEPKSTVVTTGVMSIEYTDGPEVKLEKALPGNFVTKTFSIKNTGNLDAYYEIYLNDLINNFADKTDLVYTLISNDGGANVTTQTQVPDISSRIVTSKLISPGTTHNYSLKIEFKETNDNQDDNIGKNFSSVIRVNSIG